MPEFKFLAGAFGQVRKRGSQPVQHAVAGTVAATAGNIGSVFDNSRAGWDFEQAVSNALERVIWVFRCVDAIATNWSGLPMVGRQGDPINGKIVDLDDTINRVLNRRSNPYETSEEFRYRLMAQLLLSKRGAFIEIEKNQYGDVIALHLLPPHLVEPVPGIIDDKPVFVKEYQVNRDQVGDFDVIPAERVIWIKIRPHPQDPYLQMNPLMAAQLAVETDWLSRLYNRNYLLKDGRPALLIAIQSEVNAGTAKELKHRVNGGMSTVGETIVIEADGISTVDLGGTPHEAQWLEGIAGSKNDILLAFGTPESVLGNASGRTFDNADAEREGWYMDTVQPASNRIARGFDVLTGDLNDDNFISIDWSGVNVLQRAVKEKHNKAAEDYAAGRCTLDEYLELVGKEKLGVPAARVYWHPNGMIISKDPADAEAAGELPNVQAIVGGGEQPADPEASARSGALAGSQAGARQFNNEFSARIQRLMSAKRSLPKLETKEYLEDDDDLIEGVVEPEGKVAPYEDARKQLESELLKIAVTWDQKQSEIIVGRLGHANILAFTRHWEGEPHKNFDPARGFKTLDPSKVVQVERWKEDLRREILSAAVPAVKRELRRVAQEMDSSGVVKVMALRGLGNPQGSGAVSRVYGNTQTAEKAVADVLAPLEAILNRAAARQSQRVITKIKEMDKAGRSIGEIKTAVREMIGDRSGWTQGLSEFVSGSAIEGIRAKTYEAAGPIVKKIWVTVGDEHTRATHRRADQQEVKNSGKFKVGKYRMAHPGDPSAGPEETANCRCWTEFEIADKYAEIYDETAG